MTPLRVLIIDDEAPARMKIRRLLAHDPRFRVVAEAADGLSALQLFDTARPDLALLDIQMPGLDGFEVLEALDDPACTLVFSTAYDAHALRAFEANAVDYLLKPYDADRFAQALERAVARHLGAQRLAAGPLLRDARPVPPERVVLRTLAGAHAVVQPVSILRLSADNKITRVQLRDGATLLVRRPLGELTQKMGLPILRIHRSESVNVEAVVALETLDHADAVATLEDGSSAVVSRTHRAILQRYLVGVLR